jgi:hypothetical protein
MGVDRHAGFLQQAEMLAADFLDRSYVPCNA